MGSSGGCLVAGIWVSIEPIVEELKACREWFESKTPLGISDCSNFETGESDAIEAIVKCEKAVSVFQGVGADQKIGEDAARDGVGMLSSAPGVGLIRETRSAPDGFIHVPVDRDSCICEKGVEEFLTLAGSG